MKILIVSEYFYPLLAGGELVLWDIANALTRRGHKIMVVTSRMENSPEYECVNGIEIYRPFRSGASLNRESLTSITVMAKRTFFASRLYFYLGKFLKTTQVDILYTHDYVPTLATTWIGSKRGIAVITHVGCLGGATWFRMANPLIAVLNCLMEIFVLRFGRHNALRCASSLISEKVQHYTGAKVFTIPSPIDRTEIKEVKENTNVKQIKQHLGIQEDEQFLLQVGVLTPAKNVDGLIRTLSCLNRKFKLVIVGEGPQRAAIERTITEKKMEGKVILLGQKPHKETLRIMKSCDVLVMPSKAETFSMVVVEALALGIPVLATPVGIVPEIKSPNLHVITDLRQIKELLQHGITPEPDDSVAERYSLERITSEFERMFDAVAGTGTNRGGNGVED